MRISAAVNTTADTHHRLFQLDLKAHECLRDALQDTLLSILDVWDPVGRKSSHLPVLRQLRVSSLGADRPAIESRYTRVPHLPNEILLLKSEMNSLRNEIGASREQIVQLVQEVNEVCHFYQVTPFMSSTQLFQIHAQLQEGLLRAVGTLPPIMNAERSAQFDVLALTIETCLLKLSLLRAKTHIAIYNCSSSTDSQASMLQALQVYYQRLRSKDQEQNTEEALLDAQLKEYEDLMDLVGGKGQGGFSQVVDDMARVKKETDECKRDLRRLGWTGD